MNKFFFNLTGWKNLFIPDKIFFLIGQKTFWLLKKGGWMKSKIFELPGYLKTTWKGPMSVSYFNFQLKQPYELNRNRNKEHPLNCYSYRISSATNFALQCPAKKEQTNQAAHSHHSCAMCVVLARSTGQPARQITISLSWCCSVKYK